MKLSPDNPLRRAGYRFFMLFQTVTSMGGGFHFVASHWILYEETQSPVSTAWLVICYMLPLLFINPICGVLADRYNRRKLLAISVAYVLLLDLVLIGMMVAGVFRPSHLYVYAALVAVGNSLYWTTLPAYLREHLKKEELLHANSLNTALVQGGYLLGAGLAGVWYTVLGPIGLFAVDASGFAIGFVGWLCIGRWFKDRPVNPDGSGKRPSFFREFVEGVNYARANLALFIVALFCLVPRFTAHFSNVLLAGFCMDSLQAGPKGFGLLDMSYGIGAMVCGLTLPMFFARFGLRAMLPTLAIVAAALSCCMLGGSGSLLPAMGWMAVFALFSHLVGIVASTTLQKDCDERVMGRLVSLVNVAQFLVTPAMVWCLGAYANLESGWLMHKDPIRDGFVMMAVFYFALAVLSLWAMYPFLKKRLLQPS
ncbi:MAG: MFS transporter [Opitutae bacterium]|nr:MFS transporter [Opitutae bacterium]